MNYTDLLIAASIVLMIAAMIFNALANANLRKQADDWRSAAMISWRMAYGTGSAGTGEFRGWYFLVRPASNSQSSPLSARFVAMAKREPFVAGGHIILEPADLWFEFGETEEEALSKIQAEVRVVASGAWVPS